MTEDYVAYPNDPAMQEAWTHGYEAGRSDVAHRIEERLRAAGSGWTRIDDQFGPMQYEWKYAEEVYRIIREEAERARSLARAGDRGR